MKLRFYAYCLCAIATLTVGLTPAFVLGADDAAGFSDDYIPTVLITGSNRGIGLEFAKQYAERGWNVIATTRKPEKAEALKALAGERDNVVIEPLDVTNFDQVDALAAKYAGKPIDILILNAGISGGMENQIFTKMDYDAFAKVLEVNTIAPLKISEAFYSQVAASRDKKIVTITSTEGLIGGVKRPMLYFLRSSKAAVNMVMVNLALQLKRKGIIVGLVNPGPTDTDLMAGLPKIMLRPTPVAVGDMIHNIDRLTLDTSGSFVNYDGSIIPW
jgi:NAD(P)-dependent dehydrogenase (short-subunit alcohol dehydrogenase family)